MCNDLQHYGAESIGEGFGHQRANPAPSRHLGKCMLLHKNFSKLQMTKRMTQHSLLDGLTEARNDGTLVGELVPAYVPNSYLDNCISCLFASTAEMHLLVT